MSRSTFYRCPECDDEGDRDYFAKRFCPSQGDRCKGCEIDAEWMECPTCGHMQHWPEDRDTAPTDEGLSWRQRRGDY